MIKSAGPRFYEKGGILGQNIRENWEKGVFLGHWVMPFAHREAQKHLTRYIYILS